MQQNWLFLYVFGLPGNATLSGETVYVTMSQTGLRSFTGVVHCTIAFVHRSSVVVHRTVRGATQGNAKLPRVDQGSAYVIICAELTSLITVRRISITESDYRSQRVNIDPNSLSI